MKGITYNIPADLIPEYKDRRVIVRSQDPAEIVRKVSARDNVQFVQLLSADVSLEALDIFAKWDCGVPLDITVRNPETEYPLLYNFAKLAGTRPIRVSIAVVPGFIKAVKLALALHFAVKLEVGQPEQRLVEELSEVLDLYLHGSNVSQPVEYFHSVFLLFYRQEETNLWVIQEEDPELFRFIDDEGVEHLSTRFAGLLPERLDSIHVSGSGAVEDLADHCDSCEFSAACGGFFKWPESGYDCHGVKSIFATLRSAAAELRENLCVLTAPQKGGAR